MRRLFSRDTTIRYKIPDWYGEELVSETMARQIARVTLETSKIHTEVYRGKKFIESGDLHDYFNSSLS